MSEDSTSQRFARMLFYGVAILLSYLLYLVFEPFLVPLGWAGVLVVVFYPLHVRIERRLGKTRAAAASTAGVTLILIVPALLLASLFVRQGFEAARHVQQEISAPRMPRIEQAASWVEHLLRTNNPDSAANPTAIIQRYSELAAGFLASQAGVVMRNTALFFFDLFVTLFAIFYFFRDAAKIMAGLRRLLPFEEAHRERMLSETRQLIFASVTASLVIAAVQGLLCGIGFLVVGLDAALFWGVVMAFCSLVPVVGSAIVWGPAAIWLLATGHLWRTLILVGICAGLSGLIDNFLRPMLISGKSRLDALFVFISVVGGIGVFGMLGIVLGPIVVATTMSFLETYGDETVPYRHRQAKAPPLLR